MQSVPRESGSDAALDRAMLDTVLLDELDGLAQELAINAGALALRHRRAGLTVSTKTSSTDLVTDADQAVEDFLLTELRRRRPADDVIGEEGGASRPGTRLPAPVTWVLDPIDGTVNYLLGQPQFAISVAARLSTPGSGSTTVAGAVYNPCSDALFHASLGRGAFLGHGAQPGTERLHGPRQVPLAQAIVATGFSYDRATRRRQGLIVAHLLPQVGNLRRMGSAALDLCSVAAGWVDMYFEGPIKEWDIAAGLLIAQESGAVSSGLAGAPAGPDFVAAAGPASAAEFFQILTELHERIP